MMREVEVPVSFQPSGRKAFVLRGTRLVEAADSVDLVLESPCGGEGTCGKCRVKILQGAAKPTAAEMSHFSSEELEAGWRLACQSIVESPTEVEIPAGSLVALQHQILVQSAGDVASGDDPPIVKRYVELDPPDRSDDSSDMLRLEAALALGPLSADLQLIQELPSRLRASEFCGTAVLEGGHLLDFEPGDTSGEVFAVAIDLGTTTLAASLLDLASGKELAIASRLNPQTRFGDDVLSRILHTRQNAEGLRSLQESVVTAVEEILAELCQQAGVAIERIYEITFAGNTAMQQMLCGVDCLSLGETPFVAASRRGMAFPASAIGLHIHPHGKAYVFPVIGGFVGGDTVSGVLATGLADADSPALFVDIGTNGEIVLMADGKLSAASTAAGPAFEGARISRGMRGCTGAIEKVTTDADGVLQINVIGNVPPTGLCGSGLIDAAAELLRHQILSRNGRLQPPDVIAQLSHEIASDDWKQRGIVEEQQPAFVLASADETADSRPLTLTQRDVRELQLAAGAIRAGIVILLQRAGLKPEDLQRVLIGGGFGNFIRRSNAQRIGLLPSHIEHHRIHYMGNTSLAGAKMAALSRRARTLAEALAARTAHVDLSTDMDFHSLFAEAMIFPES
jgi:uncharacterized 2Fe-2S/4Fe-4S cluster protein (DUF4445 family)